MNVCAKCGACSVVCPVYRESGREAHTARGKQHLTEVIEQGRIGAVYEELFSECLLCGRCNKVCVREIDTPLAVVKARSDFSTFYGEHGYIKFLARKFLDHPTLIRSLSALGWKISGILEATLPKQSGLRLKLGLFHSKNSSDSSLVIPTHFDSSKKDAVVYYPGCTSSYVYPGIIQNIKQIIAQTGFDLVIPKGFGCCGLAAWSAGDVGGAKQLAKQNIEILERFEGPIVVNCGSCFFQLAQLVELFDDSSWKRRANVISQRLQMVSQFLEEQSVFLTSLKEKTTQTVRVFHHDPCHLLTGNRVVDSPRQILKRIPGVELVELDGGALCCGYGGLFSLGAPELSKKIRTTLIEAILQLQPDIITTSCSGCLMQLRMGIMDAGLTIKVFDLSEFLATRIGSE